MTDVSVSAGTEIITAASKKNLDYFTVIFIGQNGGWDDPAELIEQQRAIINHQSANSDKFIIIGLHTRTAYEREMLEAAMVTEYGRRYINLREYMSSNGIKDAGLKATREDFEMMVEGRTPPSLLAKDGVRLTPKGYELVGQLVYERMDELGYFREVKRAIAEAME
jgi:lysophospholipase L1-like esterase